MATNWGMSFAENDETGIFSQAHGRQDEIAFTAGEENYRWTDVALFAMRSGDWTELEAQVREGLACEERAMATDGGPELAEVYSAADAFSRSRGLLTVEQLMTWLERSGLTVESWLGYVKRSLLRRRPVAELPGPADRGAIAAKAVADVMWAEAVCSGILNRSAHKLADLAAVAPALHADDNESEDADQGTDEPEPIVEKLRAQGVAGWALVDCRCRLKRLAALERYADLSSRVLVDTLIHDTTNPPLPDSMLFGDGEVGGGVCLQTEVTRRVKWHVQL